MISNSSASLPLEVSATVMIESYSVWPVSFALESFRRFSESLLVTACRERMFHS